MYIPAHFAAGARGELVELMRRHPFATLITVGADGAPNANHVPFLVEDGEPMLLHGHVARANPQWRELEAGGEALVVFHGPHAYISPSVYEQVPAEARVPTWNYAVVHARGRARILDDAGAQRLLERLTELHEAGRPAPWRADFDSPARRKLLGALVAFTIEVTRLEGKWKLGQNRAPIDRQRVREAHEAGAHADDQELAALMARR